MANAEGSYGANPTSVRIDGYVRLILLSRPCDVSSGTALAIVSQPQSGAGHGEANLEFGAGARRHEDHRLWQRKDCVEIHRLLGACSRYRARCRLRKEGLAVG